VVKAWVIACAVSMGEVRIFAGSGMEEERENIRKAGLANMMRRCW